MEPGQDSWLSHPKTLGFVCSVGTQLSQAGDSTVSQPTKMLSARGDPLLPAVSPSAPQAPARQRSVKACRLWLPPVA